MDEWDKLILSTSQQGEEDKEKKNDIYQNYDNFRCGKFQRFLHAPQNTLKPRTLPCPKKILETTTVNITSPGFYAPKSCSILSWKIKASNQLTDS